MIADTSFALALLSRSDPHHQQARQAFEGHGGLALQQTVLVETLQVVRFYARKTLGGKAARDAERNALSMLTESLRFHIIPVQDLDLARRIHAEHRDLSFVDACGIADARSAGGILTFDQTQRRLADAL